MADERPRTEEGGKARRAREERPPLKSEEFVSTTEFRRFKRGMKKILKVSKTEMDKRIQSSKGRGTR